MITQELETLLERNMIRQADVLVDKLRALDMNDAKLKEVQRQIHDKITIEAMPGPTYLEWLVWLHETLHPRSYMEIGVETGQSLQFARAGTFAIGVDPEPRIVHGTNTWCRIFKTTSDDFFAKHDLRNIFDNGQVDLAFIDGLHHYDQVLRDFINVEKACDKNSIVLFHDVAPAVAATATREWNTTYWAGDTWKIMTILERYRPDLKIMTIPAYPTGLGLVTNLDSTSTVLENNFDKIVNEMKPFDFSQYNQVNTITNSFDVLRNKLGL